MNRQLLIGWSILLLVVALPARGQLVSGRLVTSFYGWENFDSVDVSTTALRAYQTVQLSVAQGDLSLNTFVQGTMNFAETFGDVGRFRVYNLYLTWANIGKALDMHIGRQAVYAGAAVGSIDGALARTRLLDNKVVVTGFYGSTVGPDYLEVRENWHENYHFGGQVVTTLLPDARLGVSYSKRTMERDPYWTLRARDTTFSPYAYYIDNDAETDELLSGDARYSYGGIFTVYGRYDHNLMNGTSARAQGWARLNLTRALGVTVEYVHRRPRVSYNSLFSVFTSQATNEFEGGVEYGFTPLLRAFGRFAFVSYSEEKSHRWTFGVNSGYGSFTYAGSDGYAGQLQSVAVQGSYPVMENMLVPSAGVSFASYRLSPEDERHDALSILAGAVVRPVKGLSVDLQGQWLTNRIMSRDLRVQARITYWFTERLSLFREEGKQ
jgi:hypothetical protein